MFLDRQEEKDLTNMKELEDFITNPENAVLVYPLLITVSGLPQTGKTTSLQKAFDLMSAEETRFSHHEIVASGFGMNKPIMTLNVRRDTSFLFGLQSGLNYNHKKASFVHQNTEGLTIKCLPLKQYLTRILRYLQNRQNKTNIVSNMSKDRTVISEQDTPHALDDRSKGTTTTSELDNQGIQASDIGPPTEGPYEKSTHELEQMLFHGVGFVNIWDTVVDKTIRPFLETFGSFYTRSVLWLFVDLERDLPDIHLPPEVIEVDSKAFKWRSRIEYLLRQCQMCKHSQYKKAAKDRVCTIFATYSSSKTPHPKLSAEKLQHECEEAARQMGVDHLIDFDIMLVDKDKKKAKPLRDRLRLCLEQVEAKSVTLSWILLRGSFTQHKGFFIKYSDLQIIAKECGLQNKGEHSLDEFLKFYGSFGSIFDVRQVNDSSEYVIIKPIEFLSKVDKFLKDVEHKNGIISTDSSSDEYVMLEIMASVSIAVKLPNPDMGNRYFFRSIRKGKRKTFIAQGRVQFVLSMASPRINQNAEIVKLLLIALAPNVEFDLNTEWPNSVCIITTVSGTVMKIFLSFQGDVMEIHLQEEEECLVNTDPLVEKIVKAFEDMIFQKKHLTDIRYHFAIRCEQDQYGNTITYNAYHKRHVLPSTMCDKCLAAQKDRKIIDSWNRALKKVSCKTVLIEYICYLYNILFILAPNCSQSKAQWW